MAPSLSHSQIHASEALRASLLSWLLRYPLQRADDLVLVFGHPRASIYRAIAHLQRDHLITSVTPPGLGDAASQLVCLSQHGLARLATARQCAPDTLARHYGTDEAALQRLIPRLPFLIPLQAWVYTLLHAAPAIYTQQGRRAQIGWQWVRDYQYHDRGQEHSLHASAEALLCWQVQHPRPQHEPVPQASPEPQWYSLLVLHDTGLDDRSWLMQRVQRWLEVRESAARWPVSPQFPAVVVLVPDAQRGRYWREAVNTVSRRMSVAPLQGAIAVWSALDAATHEPPNRAWTVPWMQLTVDAPCRLQDVCVPLPQAVLLPLPSPMPQEASLQPPRSTTSIGGNWHERAQQAQPTLLASEEPKGHPRLDVTWLSLLLGKRHLDLLTFLWNHPLLPAETVAALLTLQADSVRRYLRELARYGCIEPWYPAPSRGTESLTTAGTGTGWSLTERGLHLLAALHHVHLLRVGTYETETSTTEETTFPHTPTSEQEEVHIAKSLRPQRLAQVQRYATHHQGLYWFIGQMVQAAPRADKRRLWWETGAWCGQSYEDAGVQRNLRPDAVVGYHERDENAQEEVWRQVTLWLEWDTGSMNQRDLSDKLGAYATYVQTRAWLHTGRQTLAYSVPRLLVVVPEPGQEARVQRAAERVWLTARLPVPLHLWTTTLTRVQRDGPFGAVWHPVLPLSAHEQHEGPDAQTLGQGIGRVVL